MKLLSWDVGIKNLAYVFLDYNEETKACNIIKWNVINLLPVNPVCNVPTCKKKVTMSCIHEDITYYWCDKHIKIYETLCEQAATKLKQNKVKLINCNNIELNFLRLTLVEKLDAEIKSLLITDTIDFVLIENQPVLKNPRMKGLADTLYTWHLIRGMSDTNNVKNISPVNATHKLKAFKKDLDKLKGKEKYAKTKALGIETVTQFLNDNNMESWMEFLAENDKKDDLCDCLLQGLYWINK